MSRPRYRVRVVTTNGVARYYPEERWLWFWGEYRRWDNSLTSYTKFGRHTGASVPVVFDNADAAMAFIAAKERLARPPVVETRYLYPLGEPRPGD